MSAHEPTAMLADFVAGLQWSDIPPQVQDRVVDVCIDAIASALLGQSVDEVTDLTGLAAELGTTGDTTVLGGAPTSAAAACLVNGYLVTAATICDAHLPTQCHVTPEVLPPALAAAEATRSSGEQFLAAFAAGLEVTTRVGLGLNPPVMQQRRWHAPGITGPFGGAMAVGKLIGLTPEQLRYALGLAGSSSSGTMAQWGTIAVKYHQAHGALAGLLSARLAAHGFTACEDVLTRSDGGLLSSFSDGGDPGQITLRLGDDWRLMDISLRSWPVGALVQPVVATALDIRSQCGDPAKVERLVVRLPDKAFRMHAEMQWHDAFSSRMSTRYISSVVLLDGACGLNQFSDERLGAGDVNSFATTVVTVEQDIAIRDGGAAMEATLADGSVLTAVTDSPPGHPASPLTREQVMEKWEDAVRGRTLSQDSPQLGAALQDLAAVTDMAQLIGGLRAQNP
jgi:2-methylcitrate dehydratase PrpD